MTAARSVLAAACVSLLACGGDNAAPSLALLTDQSVTVGATLRLVVTADDPDGDRVSFDIDGLPTEAQLTPRSKDEAVLVWSPLITDTQPGGRRYELTISADDGRGGTARQTIGVIVYPTFGVPAFTLPAGVVLNLAEDDDLTLLVEVKDDDSTAVSLTMTEGPDGAKLQEADTPKSAYFYWKPDDLQRTVAVHRAIFQAVDESHAPVTHTLTIVLLNTEKQAGCEGTPPSVVHHTPPDQELDGALVLDATASDPQSQVQSMVLHWTAGDPQGAYASTPFVRAGAGGPAGSSDAWSVSVTPSVATGGTLVSYYITAVDNDDPTGIACDREGRYPKTGYFTAAVYPPGSDASVCIDDRAEPDDAPGAAPALTTGEYSGRRLCGDDVDLVRVDAQADTTVVASVDWSVAQGDLALRLVDEDGDTLAVATPVGEGRLTVAEVFDDAQAVYLEVSAASFGARVSYDLALTVEGTRCDDDAVDRGGGDSTPATAQPIAIGADIKQKICPGDADYFALAASPDQPVHLALTFDHRYGDLDLDVLAADGTTLVAQSATEQSVESIDLVPDVTGTFLVRVYGIQGATNGYRLEVTPSTGACTADGLGDDTSPERAALLFQGVYEGFVTCRAEPDWFAVDLNGGETFEVLTLAETGSVSVAMYEDPTGPAVASATTDSDGFTDTTWSRATAGRIYYTVEPSDETTTYSLLQDVTDPPGACQDDRLEPNSSSLPTPITPGVTTWLRLCGMSDVDAFTVHVDAFATLVVLTSHTPGEQYTDLQVLAPDGQVRWSADDSGDGAYIEEVAEDPGTYTILVRPFDVDSALGYDLAIFLD